MLPLNPVIHWPVTFHPVNGNSPPCTTMNSVALGEDVTNRNHGTDKFFQAVNQVEAHPYLPHDDPVAFCKEKGVHITAHSPVLCPPCAIIVPPLLQCSSGQQAQSCRAPSHQGGCSPNRRHDRPSAHCLGRIQRILCYSEEREQGAYRDELQASGAFQRKLREN
jgi:hypothetical protein